MDEGAGPWFVEDDETIHLTQRPAWGYGVSLFVKALLGLALLAAGAYAGLVFLLPSYAWLVLPAASVLLVVAAIVAWRRCVTSLYVVTDKRLYAKRGRLLVRLHFASHDRVTDVRYGRGLVDRLLSIGHLTFSTAGEDVRLPGVREAARIQRSATQARDAFVEDLLARAGLDAQALASQAHPPAPARAHESEPTGEPPAGEEPASEPRRRARIDPSQQGLAPYEGPPPAYVASEETVRWLAKPTKLVLVNSIGFLVFLVPFLASAGFAGVLSGVGLPFSGGIALALVLVAAIVVFQWLRLENTELVLTDDRVYLKRGIVSTNVNQITYDKITDIAYDEGIVGRVLGFATLEVNTSGGTSKPISVTGITDALAVKRLVEEASEA